MRVAREESGHPSFWESRFTPGSMEFMQVEIERMICACEIAVEMLNEHSRTLVGDTPPSWESVIACDAEVAILWKCIAKLRSQLPRA